LPYRYLEHPSDIGVEVVAPTCEQAFAEAGVALFGIMTDLASFKPVEEVPIQAEGFDPKSLLYSWLEEMLFIFDTTSTVLVKIEVKQLTLGDHHSVQAVGFGQKFDPQRHESRTGVKAITYHKMDFETSEDKCVLRYFVDI